MLRVRDLWMTVERIVNHAQGSLHLCERDMDDMYWRIPKRDAIQALQDVVQWVRACKCLPALWFGVHKGGDNTLDCVLCPRRCRVGVNTPCVCVYGKFVGCVAKRCAQEPRPSSALFACLPKPHHLVWLESGLGPITTCLRPFWWLIFTFVRNGPFCPPPPPLAGRGVLAPFLHPFCTLCAPFVHPPFCARTPFLHPFCTPFVRWNPLSAPFLWGGFLRQGFLQEGHQMHPPGSNLVSQAYMQCLFLRSLVASPRASLCRAARCRNPTSRVSMFNTWVRPRRETRGRRRHHPRMLFLTASLKGLCLCSARILLNT